ncbi:hypothetical protein C3V36_01155 [Lachnospiraceae bacterium oral taxon 500]|nr:hypothetical protein C3V36_01155 [Lachnospiraceae bacterium oral taxon 500]
MKKVWEYFVRCVVLGLCNTVLLAVLIRTPLFEGVLIYYYRIVYLVVFNIILTLIFGIILKKIKILNISEVEIASTYVSVFLAMLFVVTIVSMPIDRSYTVYSLADMTENSDKVFTREEIEASFIEGYIYKMKATERRIQEQLYLKNIEKIGDGYRITDKGKSLINLFRLYEQVLPISEKRILYPKN